jgi:hypothetical protein
VAIVDVSRLRRASFGAETMSMEALERCSASNRRASAEIRTPAQSLAKHSRAARSTDHASDDMKTHTAQST